ncbi:UNVERIFIED_CONTAM: Nuclear transcription factor Y subunit C-1 [Sesamum calycinum]|uniref:Nuclear transcription factor Y subunit C-1 n=1 Tax=Sesamum calycinum TaxID=2727403 RepID=A0AAW2NFM8_9LAMI
MATSCEQLSAKTDGTKQPPAGRGAASGGGVSAAAAVPAPPAATAATAPDVLDLPAPGIEQVNDFKNHQLPLARIKKIMKADEDVRMISAEAPILFAKACELFILELTIRSWLHAEENKRRTLQKNDIAAAITRTDIFDFLVDIVPRDEIKDEAAALGGIVGPPAGAAGVTGVPYYYPPMGQPMMGRPAVPGVDPGVYVQAPPPSQAWQSVWQTAAEDGSYASGGGSSGQGNLDGQG